MGNSNSSLLSCAGAASKSKTHDSLPPQKHSSAKVAKSSNGHQSQIEESDCEKDAGIPISGGHISGQNSTFQDDLTSLCDAKKKSEPENQNGSMSKLDSKSREDDIEKETTLGTSISGNLAGLECMKVKDTDKTYIPYVDEGEECDVNDMLSEVNSASLVDSQLTESLSERVTASVTGPSQGDVVSTNTAADKPTELADSGPTACTFRSCESLAR